MTVKFKRFLNEDDGAVAVDWVVLTAAIIGVAIATIDQVGGATDTVSNNIATTVGSMNVGTGSGG